MTKRQYNPKNPDSFKQVELSQEEEMSTLPLNLVAISPDVSVLKKGYFQSKNFNLKGGQGFRFSEDGNVEVQKIYFNSTNIVIGSSALKANTTGIDNTAIGDRSLTANTTGNSNVAVGSDTLSSMTSGLNNVAVGRSALLSATTAQSNTAIGRSSMQLHTTGNSNTAVGSSSLSFNTTGSNNTAIGSNVMSSNETGGKNTALGEATLQFNVTGNSNVAIGYAAGRRETGSDNFYVGNIEQSSLVNDRAYSLMYGTFAGVAGSTTGQKLTINALFNLSVSKTPASAAAAGTLGDIAWDTGFIYVCTATDTWKRVAIATW